MEWISVDSGMPKDNGGYLCYTYAGIQVVMLLFNGKFMDEFWRHDDISHWMPLPAPPSE